MSFPYIYEILDLDVEILVCTCNFIKEISRINRANVLFYGNVTVVK